MDNSYIETHRLGTLQKEYGIASRFKFAGTFGPIFTGLLGVGVVVLILSAPSSGNPGDRVASYILAGLFSGLSALLLWLFLRQRTMRVQLFSGGIAQIRSSKIQAFAWDEINEFLARVTRVYVNGIPSGTSHRYTLKKQNGERMILTNVVQNVQEIADRIAEETLQVQWPIATRTLNAGQPLHFGPFIVTNDGIIKGRASLSWTEIMAVQLAQGHIKIWRPNTKRSWASVPYGSVPNAHVLVMLVQRLRAG